MELEKNTMLPKKIYKYFHLNITEGKVLSLDALENSYVYAASPKSFNDPFDCAVQADLNMTTYSYRAACRYWGMSEDDIGRRIDYYFSDDGVLTEYGIEEQESWVNQIKSRNQKFGVSCFSKQPYNPLMWAHYGGSHTGFCLEFSCVDPFVTKKEGGLGFHKFAKVNYSKNGALPKITLDDFIRMDGAADKLILEKGKRWRYEQEYRLIISPNTDEERKVKYDPEILTGIYYGKEIESEQKKYLNRIILDKYPHATEYDLKLSDQYYWLEKKYYC
jgi:hypothetical protein